MNDVKRKNMDDMLENMGSMAWGTFDRDDELELVESNNRDAYNVFKEMISTTNSELSKLFLGQTGTTDEKSFVGSAEVHERVANTYTAADKRMIQNVVNNKLLPLMVTHGMIPDGMVFAFDYTEKLTLDQKRGVIADLSPYYEFDADWITEQFGVPITGVKTAGIPFDPNVQNKTKMSVSQRVLINTAKMYSDALNPKNTK
jgi:phage gp29-like protein